MTSTDTLQSSASTASSPLARHQDAVSQYFWSRPDIPENIKSDSPDVSDWGIPSATWPSSTCDSKFWGEQTLVSRACLCHKIPVAHAGGPPDLRHHALVGHVSPSTCADVAPTLTLHRPNSGDWAGAAGVWSNGCSDAAPTCVEYVQQASPWTTAVFEVAYVRVSSSLLHRDRFAKLRLTIARAGLHHVSLLLDVEITHTPMWRETKREAIFTEGRFCRRFDSIAHSED